MGYIDRGDNMKRLSKETIETYKKMYSRYKQSNEDMFKFAESLKNKNLVSQFKNSLKMFEKLSLEQEKQIRKIYESKNKRKAQPRTQFKVQNFLNSINNCRNIKQKLPFRLNLLIGARIDELANIRKEDLTFLGDGRIKVHLRKCKGNKERTVVSIMKDKYVYDNLKKHIENLKDSDKVFYSKNYLHKIAKNHDFKNHDLRKTCIQKIYYSCDRSKEDTVKLIQAYLGHSQGSNTYKYYLDRDINATNTKFDI
jgi:integrase